MNELNALTPEILFGTLQESTVQAWRQHLKTRKYSSHIALQEFYEGIVEKTDTLVEAWISIHGEPGDFMNVLADGASVNPQEYLSELRILVKAGRGLMNGETELESMVDDILSLIDSTLYKLKNLTESRKMRSLYQYIVESKQPEPVDVICGRFQPLTKAHLGMMEAAHKKDGRRIVVLAQHSKKLDKKHPFPDDVLKQQFDIISKTRPYIEFMFTLNQSPANFDMVKGKQDGWMKLMKERNYNPHSWLCGTDRYEMYCKMIDGYAKLNGALNLKAVETPRTDDDISATKAREALANNDKDAFLKNCPKELLPMFDVLKKYVDEAPEEKPKKPKK